MALKLGSQTGVGKPKKVPAHKADYTQHLTQPVTGMVSEVKTVSGAQVASTLSETQTLNPGVFSDGMSIRVEGGRVINLGNYETVRIGVTITVPCTKDTLNDAYEFGTTWVSSKIDEAVAMAKSD